ARLAPFRAVRSFLSGGERIPESLAERWMQATGGELLSIYGMSATFGVCMVTPRRLPGPARLAPPVRQRAAVGLAGLVWPSGCATLKCAALGAMEPTQRRDNPACCG